MKKILAISLLLFSVTAFAVDTDGDGVDDSIDAFPNDICATVDTDGDGMPNTLGCFSEGFESGSQVNIQPPWSAQEWRVRESSASHQAHSGNKFAMPSWYFRMPAGRLVRQVNTTVPTALSFYFQTIPSPQYSRFSIDGVNQPLAGGNGWFLFSKLIAAGSHTLEWVADPSCPIFGVNTCIGEGELFLLDDISLGASTLLSEDLDDDNDGVVDSWDVYPLDPQQAGDADHDGIDGVVDNCPTLSNVNQLNTDGDTQGNACDSDDDNDGIYDGSDKFPLHVAAADDHDNDSFPSYWNATCDITCQINSGLILDNCPYTSNANQLNTDGDTQGDVCDDDDDNDGMPDAWEIQYSFNPLVNDASGDLDGDGFTNVQEYTNGTDPTVSNSASASVKNDYNNDAIAGWIWKGQSNGVETQSQIWQLTLPLQSPNFSAPLRSYPPIFADQANWDIVTTGDFNKDGDADILWRNNNTAEWKVWQMQDGLRVAQTNWSDTFDPSRQWQVIGAGDTDKDGDDDIILNNTTSGAVMIWQMQNYVVAATHSVGTKAGYTLNRIGDFNKDGDVDLLFRQNGGDALITWELQANAFVAERTLNSTGAGYSPVCAGDFDNDGDDDIMLVNSAASKQEKWFVMENYTRTQQVGGVNDGFVFLGCGDYDGDGDADSLWQRSTDDKNRAVLQQNWGATKQTIYTNPFGGTNGFIYRGNSN